MIRSRLLAAVLVTSFVLTGPSAVAALPDYKLGEVATEDVITPLPLQVINPEATEALKQKVAQQVQFIVRFRAQTAGEAEAELRASVAAARARFLATLQTALGRAPTEADVGSAEFARTIREVARDAAKDLPFDRYAPLWVRGQADDTITETLLQPLREAMTQPIIVTKTDTTLPTTQNVRLLPMKSLSGPPAPGELDQPGTSITPGKVVSLWRARRLVETYFPSGQDSFGRFAASFVRVNAVADAELTELSRAQRLEGVTVNDTYDAAQAIIRKGQTIDRKALSALAVLREKSMIGTLQTKLEQEKTVAGQIRQQTSWIAAALVLMAGALGLILWRLRSRPSTALVLSPDGTLSPFEGAGPGTAAEAAWRSRAMLAEGQAERAQQAIRTGVLGWMKEKFVQTLFRHRAELLSVQQKAEAEMRELEQRLEQLQTPLQERISAYEKRIEELEKDLAAKGEENRELIGARISVARQQLILERERTRFGTN